MFNQKLNKNKKLNSVRKTITALLIISMLISMVQTSVFAAEEPLRIQVGNNASTWDAAITEANSKGSAIIEIISDITLTSNIAITSDITIISAKGDHTITVPPSYAITIQGGNLIIGDDLATNLLTISSTNTAIHVKSGTVHIKDGSTVSATGDGCKAIFVDNGDVIVSGGTISANGEDCKAIYVITGDVIVSGGTVTATGDYCSAIEVITGNVVVSGGTVTANAGIGHYCYAISLGVWNSASGGTVTITGGKVSAINAMESLAISLQRDGLAAYLAGTCTGTFETFGTSIIVEVESLDIPSAYGGTNNGLTRKAGSAISNVKWDISGAIFVISFNNKQYTIEWPTYSICEIIDTDGVTMVGAYVNFTDALAAVQNGQTIRLLDNIEYKAGIKITNKSITFDVNGFILNVISSTGHGLEVGSGGEVLLNNQSGGKFNVKGGGSSGHGVYVHGGGKAEVTDATTSVSGMGSTDRGVYAIGQGSEVTVYGNIPFGGFYGLGANDGAKVTVYGYVEGGGGMIVSGLGTTVTVYGYSSGGGTGVIASDRAVVYVKGNVIGGGVGISVSTGAQVTVDGIVKAKDGQKVYVKIDGENKMQEQHEPTSDKPGYFEYKSGSGDSIVWVKDPVVYNVRHRETGNLYTSIGEAIAAIKPSYSVFVLEVLGDVVEKDHIIINNEDVTLVSIGGNHIVTFTKPTSGSSWKFALQGGGTLTLGEDNAKNTLTIMYSVSVTNGHIIAKDGVIIKSNSTALYLSGPNAVGTISGGRFEGNGESSKTGTGLSLEKGAKIIEISGGVFVGNIDAVHVSDAGTRINKISGGAFYQTDPNTNLHGHAIFVQNEAQIDEISGGYFEAVRNCALTVLRGAWINEISGGEFVATRRGTTQEPGPDQWNSVIHVETRLSEGYSLSGIGVISDGWFHGGAHFGMLLITLSGGTARVDEISGGLFNGVVGVQVDVGGEIGTISGGKIIANQGMLNTGKIGEICGDVEIHGTSSYGIFNYNYYGNFNNPRYYGTIGEISGNAIILGKEYGIANTGKIDLISGGTITSSTSYGLMNSGIIDQISGGTITSSASHGIANAGTIKLISGGTITSSTSHGILNRGIINQISGGTIIGAQSAIYCYVLKESDQGTWGVLEVITNGVFWGKSDTAIVLNSTLQLEPGLSANKGLGRYQSGNGAIFNDETLVKYPAEYYMSARTTSVEGINDVRFRYLTLDDKYTIEYVLNGGINNPNNPAAYDEKDLPCQIVAPTRVGYDFQGWTVKYLDGSQADITIPTLNYNIKTGTTGDIILTANWNPTQYKIIYNLNGGDNAPGNPTTYSINNLPIKIADPKRLGYEFWGWEVRYANGTAEPGLVFDYVIPEGTTGDITLTANGPPVLYSITYNLNGGNHPKTPNTYTVMSTFPINIANPTKTGYEFQGWTIKYQNGATTTNQISFQIIEGTTGNIELTANWSKATSYNIIYKLNGSNHPKTPNTYTVEKLPLSIADPIKVGYEFEGWEITYADHSMEHGIKSYTIPKGTTGDIILEARFGPHIWFDITYNLNGGEHPKTPAVYAEDSIFPINIANPTKTGYEFQGWTIKYQNGATTTNQISFQIIEGTTGNIELTANWSKATSYNIIYNLNEGEHSKTPSSYTVEDLPVAIANPTRLGYEFWGWEVQYANGTAEPGLVVNYVIPKGTTGDITLTAKGHTILYNIIYNLDGGEHSKTPNSYTILSTFPISIANPTKINYTFQGWTVTYANGTSTTGQMAYSIPAGTTGDIVLTANWRANNSGGGSGGNGSGSGLSGTGTVFKVQFVDWDGTLLKMEFVRLGGSATAPKAPTREGYSFTMWDREFTNVRSDIIVTAQYTPKETVIPPLEGGDVVPVWALVNLVLSVAGIILAIIVTIGVLLQQMKQQENQQKNNKFQNATVQSSEQEKQQEQRKLGLITALALGVAGVLVFLLTEDMSHKMTLIDNWTIVNAIIFIAEIIALTFIFKHKKDTKKEKTKP